MTMASKETVSGSSSHCINFQDVLNAAERIRGDVIRTPLLAAPPQIMNLTSSGENVQKLFFKVEAMQRTGSFKFRGALNAIRHYLEETEDKVSSMDSTSKSPLTVVTHSSGNHAQAVALAARTSSTEIRPVMATIVMPRNAPLIKLEGTRSYGADVRLVDNTNEARELEASRVIQESDHTGIFIHPSEHPSVIAGQGTASLEILEQIQNEFGIQKPDAVIIPVGGGGLASGNAVALRGALGGSDSVKIILAEPQQLDDAKRSFDAGVRLQHDPTNTLDSVADGLKTTLGPNTWPIVRDLVDDIYTVSEDQILRATKIIWEQLKICIEPSAGVGVAVALYNEEFKRKYNADVGIQNVVVILCGGNVDILKTCKLMEKMGI
jgi:serine racemase